MSSNQPHVLVEACVTSPGEAVECFGLGAQRVELCRKLDCGGLTPARVDIASASSAVVGPVFVLVRARAGDFRMAPTEISQLLEDIAEIASLGANGVVVGVLDRRGHVDGAALEELVSAAGGLPVTFHRAFDHVESQLDEVEVLVRAGITRVLTSGGASTAWEGKAMLKNLVEATGAELIVLAAGGVRGDHVSRLVTETGVTEVHARASAIPGIMRALG